MKPCEEYFESIIEYAHGDGTKLSPEERPALEAHLGGCEACRAELRSVKDLLDLIRPTAHFDVPQQTMETVRDNVLRSVRRRHTLQPTFRISLLATSAAVAALITVILWPFRYRNAVPSSVSRNVHSSVIRAIRRRAAISTSLRLGIAVAATAILTLLIASLPAWRSEREATSQNSGVVSESRDIPALSAVSPLCVLQRLNDHASTQQPEMPSSQAATTQRALRNAKRDIQNAIASRDEEAVRHVLADLTRIRASATGMVAANATRAMAECYLHLGLVDDYYSCFIQYAESLGTQDTASKKQSISLGADSAAKGGGPTAEALFREAGRLLASQEYIMALRFYDLVMSRYRGAQVAARAHLQQGYLYSQMNLRKEAAEAYETLIADAPDSPSAQEAIRRLPYIRFNLGLKREAVTEALRIASQAHTAQEQADAQLCAGQLLASQPDRVADAVAALRKVTNNHPGTPAARKAQRSLGELQLRMIGRFFNDQIMPD